MFMLRVNIVDAYGQVISIQNVDQQLTIHQRIVSFAEFFKRKACYNMGIFPISKILTRDTL